MDTHFCICFGKANIWGRVKKSSGQWVSCPKIYSFHFGFSQEVHLECLFLFSGGQPTCQRFGGVYSFLRYFQGEFPPSWQWRVAATERVIALTTRENSQPFFGSPATWGSTGVAWKTSFFHLFQCLVMFFFCNAYKFFNLMDFLVQLFQKENTPEN